MQQSLFLPLVFMLILIQPANAQRYDQLKVLKHHTVPVYYSAGHEQRAASIAQRIDRAITFHQQLLGFRPTVTVLVLDTADWKKYTLSRVVYGMPHYNKDTTLIVAAEDNPFWKSFLPPLAQLPKDIRQQVEMVYSNKDGSITAQPFFDLLALHELGHAFQLQGGLTMQRQWMSELFCNILLHTYIAENEPEALPALTLFPRMVAGGSTKGFTYTSLSDLEKHYNEIAQQYPRNYGWYQCRWHSAAAGIYDAAGKTVCRKLWDAFKSNKTRLTDEALPVFLETSGAKTVADMMLNWDKDTIR